MQPTRAENIIGNFTHVEAWREIGANDNPDFENSWANVNSTQKARFMKDPFGFVHLAGKISSGSAGTTAFTLPEGYRPDYVSSTAGTEWAAFTGHTNSTTSPSRILVGYAGAVHIQNFTTEAFLDGISFRAA